MPQKTQVLAMGNESTFIGHRKYFHFSAYFLLDNDRICFTVFFTFLNEFTNAKIEMMTENDFIEI